MKRRERKSAENYFDCNWERLNYLLYKLKNLNQQIEIKRRDGKEDLILQWTQNELILKIWKKKEF